MQSITSVRQGDFLVRGTRFIAHRQSLDITPRKKIKGQSTKGALLIASRSEDKALESKYF